MLADALGHELVVRTSADLVSKYVGETERNLTALFNGLGAASLRPQAALPPARAGPASRPVCPRSAGREHPGGHHSAAVGQNAAESQAAHARRFRQRAAVTAATRRETRRRIVSQAPGRGVQQEGEAQRDGGVREVNIRWPPSCVLRMYIKLAYHRSASRRIITNAFLMKTYGRQCAFFIDLA